jgi:hypothetical protein
MHSQIFCMLWYACTRDISSREVFVITNLEVADRYLHLRAAMRPMISCPTFVDADHT